MFWIFNKKKKENSLSQEAKNLITDLKNLHVHKEDRVQELISSCLILNDVELENTLLEIDSNNKEELYKVSCYIRMKY